MPPPDGEHHLKPEEIALIKRWIEQGAEWQRHWSFLTLSRPDLPEIEQTPWIRQPLDHFASTTNCLGIQSLPRLDQRRRLD